MRKLFLVPAVAAMALGPVSALAAITLNGQTISNTSDFTISQSGGNVTITTGSGPVDPTEPTDPTGPTDPTDPTDPTEPTGPTDPTDPVDPNCGALPGNVTLVGSIDWASQGGQTFIDLDNTDISTSAFTSTSSSGYFGQVSVVSVTGTSGFKREVWISECPGGPKLSDSRCTGQGSSSTNIYWTQGATSSWQCNLERNKSYYLNYRNVDCTRSSCGVYRNMYNNKRP